MPLKFPRQRARDPETPGVRGLVRVDARTKNLTKRLRPGDIAVIDHQDIDQVSAEALLACRPAAVVNAAPSISGRYPNLGPEILVDAGHPAARRRRQGRHARPARGRSRSGSTATSSGSATRSSPRAQAFDHELVAVRHDRGPGRARRPARGVRRQHDGVPAARARPAARRRRRPRHHAPDRRPARADRGARLPLQGGPAAAAHLHPRVPAGADRRRRRRRRAARGRATSPT